MSSDEKTEVTRLLEELTGGNRTLVDALLPIVYGRLHDIARRHLRHERPDHTLNATALINEAYLKLIEQDRVDWQNRAHFLSVASIAMRRILLNYARNRAAAKRGGGNPIVTFNEEYHGASAHADDLIDLDRALTELEGFSPRQARVVEMVLFGGLTHEEIGVVLEVSTATIHRDWRLARAWLTTQLADKGTTGGFSLS